MSSYQDFASLYDALTFDVDYKKIADFIEARLKAYGIPSGLILDLACGTGTLSLELASRGYTMIGVDASEDMLAIARQKKGSENILFLNQPMEAFELYGTVDAIVCVLDSLNYLTEPEALLQTFRLCANYLNPDGVLLFDVNSMYKFEHVLGQETYTYETDRVFYIWENDYHSDEELCYLYLSFFKEEKNGLYRRIDETHVQRAYCDKAICQALSAAGLTIKNRFDDYTDQAPISTTQRIVYEVEKL